MRLLTDLKHQMSIPLAAATEDLLTGSMGRDEFVKSMLARGAQLRSPSSRVVRSLDGLKDLPISSKFLLVAGYCASYNPAKSDIRLFGRGTGPDGKRRRGGGTRRAGYGKTRVGKANQQFLYKAVHSLTSCRSLKYFLGRSRSLLIAYWQCLPRSTPSMLSDRLTSNPLTTTPPTMWRMTGYPLSIERESGKSVGGNEIPTERSCGRTRWTT